MATRILFIYQNLSTMEIEPLKHILEDSFDEIKPYHIPLEGVKVFLEGSGEFDYVFFEDSISEDNIKNIKKNSKKTIYIKGLTISAGEVKQFISSE